jgi:molecular chaperone DnaK
LGGDDFDRELERIILQKAEIDFTMDEAQQARLRDACEQAKKELSATTTVQVNIPYFGFSKSAPVHVKVNVSRDDFETALVPLLEKTHRCVEQALRDAELTFKDIDEVVFVGGSTRIPRVAQAVEEWTGKRPNRTVNPDEAVAIGAAIQASILSGQSDKQVFLVDVTPLSLGVETQGGVMDVLIRRNTHVPAQASQTYTTAFDGQSSVDVKVYQGERPQTKDNRKLGEFQLAEIPSAPRGVPQIEVAFEIDADGILSVKAIDKATLAEQTVILSGNASLSFEEVQKMIADAEANKAEDAVFIAISSLQALICDQIVQGEELKRTNVLNQQEMEELDDLLASLEEAKESRQLELLNSLADAAKETLTTISESVYQCAQKHLSE